MFPVINTYDHTCNKIIGAKYFVKRDRSATICRILTSGVLTPATVISMACRLKINGERRTLCRLLVSYIGFHLETSSVTQNTRK